MPMDLACIDTSQPSWTSPLTAASCRGCASRTGPRLC
jgi:hypothetical protein